MPTRFVRFTLDHPLPPTTPDSQRIRYGMFDGEQVHESPRPFSRDRGKSHPREDVHFLPPTWPTKIVCVGRNYPEHAKELGNEVPKEPLLFLKPPSSLLAHGGEIVYPALSQRVDYEGELGVVIGRTCKNVSAAEALDYVAGFTIVNDMTARDLQRKDGQFTRGKGFDTFCPVGPWIVPPDELELDTLRIETRVNGELKQDGLIRDMLFPVGAIIEYISQVMTLEVGDLIATGTPPGVAPVEPGAEIEVSISGIGTLRNRVIHGGTK